MMHLLPNQLRALQNTLDGVASKAAALLGVDIERVERFLANAAEFASINAGPLDRYTYLFLFDGSISDGSRIDLSSVVRGVNTDKSLFHVDEELRLIEIMNGEATITECGARTKDGQALGLRLHGTYFWEFLGGFVEGQDDFEHPGSIEPRISKWLRPMSDFLQILDDHNKSRVASEAFTYWHDRSRRILVGNTEHVFHKDLFWWLNHYVVDKLSVYAEPSGFGQGKVDVVVVTVSGSHVLELKWLGENEHGTRYDEADIDPGLVQIATYLENDNSFICGYLLIYDGRSRDKHETHCEHDEVLRHRRCKDPIILFLESESPSKKARRIVQERHNEQGN